MTLVSRLKTVCLISVLVLSCAALNAAYAETEIKPDTYRINDITWTQKDGVWLCQIKGDVDPSYTMYELFTPHRVILDVANGLIGDNTGLPMEFDKGPVSRITGRTISDKEPQVARVELYLAADIAYEARGLGNDILVQFNNGAKAKMDESQPGVATIITDVKVVDSKEKSRVYFRAEGPIRTYKTAELARENGHPSKLIVDIAGIQTSGHAVPAGNAAPITLVRTENYKGGTRVVIDSASADLFGYSISSRDDGLLIVAETPAIDPTSVIASITGLPASSISKKKIVDKKADDTKKAVEKKPSAALTKSQDPATSDFAFAGYNEQKISVDFYKIDLHNVFRLIGDISGRNIVVAEGVGGSLTLTLNDVPWDFVLDVILNLKDLAKEERFNTIVISQKSKGFAWPEAKGNELEIEIDADPLKVQQRLDIPKETLEAKRLMRKAQDLEKEKQYDQAIKIYEKSLEMWPENSDLAQHIATMSLVHFGRNAKAAHYAQKAFKLDPDNTKAALTAAISLANLEKIQEAKGYFEIAVSAPKPDKQALFSYAAFSEQNQSYDAAVNILQHYEKIYGSSLKIMISKARIYDKNSQKDLANAEYRSALHSGEAMPENLKTFIQNRLAE